MALNALKGIQRKHHFFVAEQIADVEIIHVQIHRTVNIGHAEGGIALVGGDEYQHIIRLGNRFVQNVLLN